MHRVAAFWVNLRSSLWFLPTLIVAGAVALAWTLAELGRTEAFSQSALPSVFGFSAEGSRAMLSAIASSMITVAGVAFSVTIVALSLASTQYSPRVLRNFMRDRGNQSVLGVFVGIFAYCLVVLPLVRGGEEAGYVPALAVATAVVLALVGVGCLIYFIHHVATSIQAASIVGSVAAETHVAIEQLFPETLGEDVEPEPAELKGSEWHPVPSTGSGVLQLVDEKTLLAAAARHDVVVRMEYHVGDFVVTGTPLASWSGGKSPMDKALASEIEAAFVLNRMRTIEQDPAFGFRQIVDVALRALSPSVNDATTALLCINHLADLLRHAGSRHAPSCFRRDNDRLRVVAKRQEFEGFVTLAFDQIRESGAAKPEVLGRLLWSLDVVAPAVHSQRRRRTLWIVAREIEETALRALAEPSRRDLVAQHARQVASRLTPE